MLLASFTSGLVGTPGRNVRFSLPKNLQEALRIAVTVQQAELQERRNETYVDEVQERGKADRSSSETRRSGYMRNTTQQVGASRTQDLTCKGSSRNLGRVNRQKCLECGGLGHFARECPSHQNRRGIRNRTSTTGEMPSRFPQPSALRNLGGNPRDEGMTAVGERTGNGSRGSCFHTTAPENQTDYFTVRVELISGTPSIQALISGFRRVFIVDTGSSISLIQSRVYLSDVSPTNLSPFGVNGNQKYKRHS